MEIYRCDIGLLEGRRDCQANDAGDQPIAFCRVGGGDHNAINR